MSTTQNNTISDQAANQTPAVQPTSSSSFDAVDNPPPRATPAPVADASAPANDDQPSSTPAPAARPTEDHSSSQQEPSILPATADQVSETPTHNQPAVLVAETQANSGETHEAAPDTTHVRSATQDSEARADDGDNRSWDEIVIDDQAPPLSLALQLCQLFEGTANATPSARWKPGKKALARGMQLARLLVERMGNGAVGGAPLPSTSQQPTPPSVSQQAPASTNAPAPSRPPAGPTAPAQQNAGTTASGTPATSPETLAILATVTGLSHQVAELTATVASLNTRLAVAENRVVQAPIPHVHPHRQAQIQQTSYASTAARAPDQSDAVAPPLSGVARRPPSDAPRAPSSHATHGRPLPQRVVLRASDLSEQHPLRTKPTAEIMRLVEERFQADTDTTLQAVRRLASGDLALELASEADVQKVFRSPTTWIEASLASQGPLPVMRLPDFITTTSLVVHGVSCDLELTDVRQELAAKSGHEVVECRWILGPARRAATSHSMVAATMATEEGRDYLIQQGKVGLFNRVAYTAKYQRRERVEQCSNCHGYGHSGRCPVKHPVCRLCGDPHKTEDHSKCNWCKGQPAPDPASPAAKQQLCQHQHLRCANCNGPHAATNKLCPARLAHMRN